MGLVVKRVIVAGVLVVTAVGVVAGVGYLVVWPKLADLRYRIQLIEARQASFGAFAAAERIAHQAERGDADLRVDGSSPFGAASWREIGGDWSEARKTKALGTYDDDLCVGLQGRRAEVWCFDGDSWGRIGEWPDLTYVHALLPHADALVAGINEQVWTYDGARWANLEAPTGSDDAYALASQDDTLFVGAYGSGARVLAYDAAGWREASTGLPTTGFTGIYELWTHSDGMLYAGLSSTLGATMVYRLEDARWMPVGGRGLNGSWQSDVSTYAFSFASLQDQLIVTLNRHPMAAGSFSPVWAFDGHEWHPVGAASVPSIWGEMDSYNAAIAWRGRLYIGAGGAPAGNASVWELDSAGWREVGGHGVNGSWGPGRMSNTADASREYVYRLIEWRDALVVGFGDGPGAAQVWLYDP
jgi:hypothetical protein